MARFTWAIIAIAFFNCIAFGYADEADKYPKIDETMSISSNIEMFKRNEMPAIGICSRLSGLRDQYSRNATAADIDSVARLLKPIDIKIVDCFALAITRLQLVARVKVPSSYSVKRLDAMLVWVREYNRENPDVYSKDYGGFRRFPTGASVCDALWLLTKSKRYENCVFSITFTRSH